MTLDLRVHAGDRNILQPDLTLVASAHLDDASVLRTQQV